MVRGRRLLVEHVSRVGEQAVLFKRGDQRGQLDEFPAGRVDDDRALPDQRKIPGVEEVPRGRGELGVKRDDVGAPQR